MRRHGPVIAHCTDSEDFPLGHTMEYVKQQNQWLRQRWNNNACASINLKLSVNWRPMRLPDLVEYLHKVVEMQMADLRHALHSQGNFKVTPPFGNFVVVWQSMSAEDKDAHVASFVAYRPRQVATSTTVTSTNGVLTVPVTKLIATKPGQRK